MQNKQSAPVVPQEELKRIITDPTAGELTVKRAKEQGDFLAEKPKQLSTSQIRAIFDEVRQIEALWDQNAVQAIRRLSLLKPKMQYRANKEGGKVKDLVKVLEASVNEVLKGSDEKAKHAYFRNFVDFFEAILAYHKAAGGK